jgi:hypothetical protein
MMGKNPYNITGNSFGLRLKTKLANIKPSLEKLIDTSLIQVNLEQYENNIAEVYRILSLDKDGALNQDNHDHFHVGTTKVLHFLNPKLFIIVDSNAARAFSSAHGIKFTKSTLTGYSAENYIKCMKCAQQDIITYGIDAFQSLEQQTPITRIYDKLTFVTGAYLKSK